MVVPGVLVQWSIQTTRFLELEISRPLVARPSKVSITPLLLSHRGLLFPYLFKSLGIVCWVAQRIQWRNEKILRSRPQRPGSGGVKVFDPSPSSSVIQTSRMTLERRQAYLVVIPSIFSSPLSSIELPTRIKSGSTKNDIDRNQQEQNEYTVKSICGGDYNEDDLDFEMDEMDDSVCGIQRADDHNNSSSSGLDDQKTKKATEETISIPQIKKGNVFVRENGVKFSLAMELDELQPTSPKSMYILAETPIPNVIWIFPIDAPFLFDPRRHNLMAS
ncbi:hypothetical protein PPACK8108_LOCUS7861 [Phakopsora pachyrhizi]|uniref:Uncharacterized protein n=1 Tax=Phakopsora pachyrhizi TaxID=170000 RepID=A0AAV0AU78_PHAPC|nr:hypothetical protein PPACK8108_LOCUS7861 [Phakopsora pachyrhizi]